MSKTITLKTIADQLTKRDAKDESRFEMIKSEFQWLEGKVDDGFAKVQVEFARVHKDLSIIQQQTAHLTERGTKIERDIGTRV